MRSSRAARLARLFLLTVSQMGFQPGAVGTIVVEVDDVVEVDVEVSVMVAVIMFVMVS